MPATGYTASSGSTPFRVASGMVGMGAYSIGSKMPTGLWAPAQTVKRSFRKRIANHTALDWGTGWVYRRVDRLILGLPVA